jgi:hypothetical protein
MGASESGGQDLLIKKKNILNKCGNCSIMVALVQRPK